MPIGNGYVGIWTTYRAPLSSVSAIALIGAVVCTQPVGAQSAGTAVTRGALNNGPVTRRVIGPATPIISAMPTGIRPSIIRGMLLLGKMRARTELDAMSGDDHRNTLITEVAGRTRDGIGFYQRLSDSELAGIGAVLSFLLKLPQRPRYDPDQSL